MFRLHGDEIFASRTRLIGDIRNYGRVFPMTIALRKLLERQQAQIEELRHDGHIVLWVFFRMVATKRGGKKVPRAVLSFN